MHKAKLEICCFNLESALTVNTCGADRIEFCKNYSLGGITPVFTDVEKLLDLCSTPVNVMIRPRGGDFSYSEAEFNKMLEDIKVFKGLGVNGIVTGVLDNTGEVDQKRMKEILQISSSLEVTFHRAFDICNNQEKQMEILIDFGIDRILTSGRDNNAIDSLSILKQLVEQADERIIVMPGGGVRSTNIKEIMEYTAVSEIHSSAILPKETNSVESFNDKFLADGNEILDMLKIIKTR